MKSRIVWVVIYLMVAVNLVACGEGGGGSSLNSNTNTNTNTNTNVANYFPSSLNSSWTYNASSGSTSYTSTNLVTRSGSNTFSVKVTTSLSASYQVNDYSMLSNNAWAVNQGTSYNSNGSSVGSVSYSPAFPITPSSWTAGTHNTVSGTTSYTPGGINYSYTQDITINGIEAITVPAGTFNNSVKVTVTTTTNGNSSTVIYWFADGVGIVKYAGSASGTSFGAVLASYTIH